MSTPFSAPDIARYCQQLGLSMPLTIEAVEETGSTNADLLARLPQLQGATVRVAERQSAGRGRAGRVWYSAPGASLTFSLAWRMARPLQEWVGLPLAVGVAIAEALASQAVRVQLKWPNDIWRDGKKLGGILIASASVAASDLALADSVGATDDAAVPRGTRSQSPDRAHPEPYGQPERPDANWAVIGIGLNLTVPDALEQQIGHAVADAPWLAQQDRNRLLAGLLVHLVPVLEQFERDGMPAFTARWNRFHAFSGQMVQIVDHGELLHEGRASGIDGQGRLLLETGQGQVAVWAGDVSLRPAHA